MGDYIIKVNYLFILLIISSFFGCSIYDRADKIYVNGNIYTGSSNNNRQKFIATKGEFIIEVGTGDYKHLVSEKTEVIDLNNKFVVPGFIDNHTHFMSGGSMLMSIDLHSANTPDAFNSRFQSYVKNIETGEWITGGNWDHEHWG